MENNTQLKEMIRSMVIDILQGQKQEMASSQPIKQAPRGQVEPGVFDTVDEAFKAYKGYKESIIKSIAKQEFDNGNITIECYNAMMHYEVEITD